MLSCALMIFSLPEEATIAEQYRPRRGSGCTHARRGRCVPEGPRTDADEKLVDRRTASPHFGERWATHWLDVVRFAETNGFEGDRTRRHAGATATTW